MYGSSCVVILVCTVGLSVLVKGMPGQYGGYLNHLTHLGGDDKGVDKRGSYYHFRSFSYPFRSLQPAIGKRNDPSQAGSWRRFRGMEFVGKRSRGKAEGLDSERQKRPSLYLLNSLNV